MDDRGSGKAAIGAVTFDSSSASAGEVRDLLQAAGMWAVEASLSHLTLALQNSAIICAARNPSGELVGVGRMISDGAVFGVVAMLVVHPVYQSMGIGSAILTRMLSASGPAGQMTSLVLAERDKGGFYIKHGFHADSAVLMHRPDLGHSEP